MARELTCKNGRIDDKDEDIYVDTEAGDVTVHWPDDEDDEE